MRRDGDQATSALGVDGAGLAGAFTPPRLILLDLQA
jgi:hypothetical protein